MIAWRAGSWSVKTRFPFRFFSQLLANQRITSFSRFM
jgi:hypothetical protein